MANPQTRQSPVAAGLQCRSEQNLHVQNASAEPLLQSCNVTELPPWRLARHAAALIDTLLGLICSGRPIGILGRKVLHDLADRLRQLSEVLR